MSVPDFARMDNGFERVLLAVREFGSALGAMDHGGPWEKIEAEAHEIIRRAFADLPELAQVLPKLAAKMQAGASVANDGTEIANEVRRARRNWADQLHPTCQCLSDSAQPYDWWYDRYQSLGEKHTGLNGNRVTTIRCQNCGRRYEVETDETLSTHAVHTWSRLAES